MLLLFFQLVDGILQRFGRLNDVVGAPKTFVGKVEHLIRQGLIGLESEAIGDAALCLPSIGDHHLGDDRIVGGEEFALPVALETHLVADIAEASDSLLLFVGD